MKQEREASSHTGIDKGTRSLNEIATSLGEAGGGIICLTSENLTKPWILFEAGALSRQPGDRVWTVLLDVDNAQVEPPLGQFQHTSVDKDDLYRLFVSMNAASGQPRRDHDLRFMFEAAWDKEVGRVSLTYALKSQAKSPPRGRPTKSFPRFSTTCERSVVTRGSTTRVKRKLCDSSCSFTSGCSARRHPTSPH